ncbi:MAG: hypothetical protein LH650_15680, partial [Chloroflexi bacterium]|nr:hypothetical protein [Chloroflexota bacterium]
MDPWNQVLDLLSQVVTPLWATLLQYIPLLLLGLTVLVMLSIVRAWASNASGNASRVPRAVAGRGGVWDLKNTRPPRILTTFRLGVGGL